MPYLVAQGVLQAGGLQLDPAADKKVLEAVRVREEQVTALRKVLQSALADPQAVISAYELIDITVINRNNPPINCFLLRVLCSISPESH